MSKSRQRRKAKQPAVHVSPLSLLRPRLDTLLGDETLAHKDDWEVTRALEDVCASLKPEDFLPVLLRACQAAPAPVQERLNDVVPRWLEERSAVEALHTLAQRPSLNPQSQSYTLAWLEAAGIDTAAVQEMRQQTPLYGAYRYSDHSQGIILMLWYTDGRQNRVQGMGFLLDFNPPWEGAVKDIMLCSSSDPERALRRYVHFWADKGTPLHRVSDAEAKQEVLEHLAINRQEGIRLPRDLVVNRRLFLDHVLTLPDTPETPPFTAEDFDALSRTGETAESIRNFEQRVGRRVRIKDGQEALILGAPFDHDFFDDETEDDE